jgi:ABC-type branched-subunit amino acid transport system ATPase component
VSIALEATGVTVQFGGLRALSDVDIKVAGDEIVGLIGGNGAGKTTFMDCVSGYVQPLPGASIRAFGEELVGLPPEMRPFLDVGRSYQSARLFPGLTVTESLLVAVERHNPTSVLGAVLGLSSARAAEAAKRERVDELVAATGLEVYREKLVGELSTGTRRLSTPK